MIRNGAVRDAAVGQEKARQDVARCGEVNSGLAGLVPLGCGPIRLGKQWCGPAR